MNYKLLLSGITLSLVFSNAFGQTQKEMAIKRMTDSLKMEGLSTFAMRYPQLRQGFIATDIIGKGHVKGELNGKELYEGEKSMTRIRSNFSIPVSQWGKNLITGTISYQQTQFKTDQITSYHTQFANTDKSITKSTAAFTAVYSRSDSMFNKQVIYSAGISGITDELSSIKRLNYLATVTVPLKRNQHTSVTVGLVVIVDPSSVAPVVPIVSYWHKFAASDLELFVDMPSRIALRKQLSKKAWTSIGTELGGGLIFFDLDQPSLPQNNIYTTLEFRSGATFEYLLTKKLILGVNGGFYTTTAARMFDRKDKPTDYFFKSQTGTVPYVSFSVSFLPFLKRL